MFSHSFLRTGRQLGVAAVLLALASPAVAHPKLSASIPAAGTTTSSPNMLSLQLSEKLEPKFSGVKLMKADGSNVPIAAKVGGKDGKTIEANVKGKLAPGRYMVMWHAVAADGHPVKGDYNFTVR